ncbi:MAG: protein kinase [Fuerstiella sp.]|nr:protein kinase [Fuerstiella sp.]
MNDSGDTQIQGDDEREDSRQMSLEGNQPPAQVEGYTMIRRLGTGAYGTVWLAREDNTGRMVAIKYYPHRRGLNWSLLSREVEKLATLYTSRNIVQLLDVGWNSEPPYYVMEFVENGSLSAYMAHGPLAVSEAVRITKEVCRALIEAHGAGVLHCDLKPDNVLLDSSFQVRLCDFGQSRMSHERSPALGTLYYMAPEQADLEAVADARWDVYAVGALLYRMLTGEAPFRTRRLQKELESTESISDRLAVYRDAIKTSPQPNAQRSVWGVDKRLIQLIDNCLCVDPSERLPNAQAILAELEGRDQQRTRRPLLLLGVLGPLLLIAGMVPLFVSALRDNVHEMELRLTERALESNALSARALAGALESELEGRLADLLRVAELEIRMKELGNAGKSEASDSDELIGPLEQVLNKISSDTVVMESQTMNGAPMENRPEWMQSLDRARLRADARNYRRGHKIDVSWFLQDQHGRQLWRSPYSANTVGENFARRAYYHGRNKDYQADEIVPDDIRPISEPHISPPFKSQATGQSMVALSVPVKNSSGEVIGVLARTAHLADLRFRLAQYIREYESLNNSDDSIVRTIAIAHAPTGRLFDHPWLNTQSSEKLDDVVDKLVISDEILARLKVNGHIVEDAFMKSAQADTALLETYIDPVGLLPDDSAELYRQELMAAIAQVRDSKSQWIVIVQEPRANVHDPVTDMTFKAIRTVCIAIVTSILLMAIVWFFVSRALARSNI